MSTSPPPTNDAVYAGGLLLRALDPSLQPPEIRAWFADELALLDEFVPAGSRLLDLGCGTGRHLRHLGRRLAFGLGVDYERSYLAEGRRLADGSPVHYVQSDATACPTTTTFDVAICMTNTWGTMSDKAGVLAEMRRLAPRPGSRLVSVYAPDSVPARREWYPRMGHPVERVTDECVTGAGGFRSEHFTEARLRDLIGPCTIRVLAGGVGHAAVF